MLPFEGQWGINDSMTSQHRWRYSVPLSAESCQRGLKEERERENRGSRGKGERHQRFWPNSIAYLKQFILSSWQSWTLDGSLNRRTFSTSTSHLKHTMSEEKREKREGERVVVEFRSEESKCKLVNVSVGVEDIFLIDILSVCVCVCVCRIYLSERLAYM